MGILNKKDRVIDTVITSVGRKNLAERGGVDARYYSFSDIETSYSSYNDDDIIGVSEDLSSRVGFEVSSNQSDNIFYDPKEFQFNINDLTVIGNSVLKNVFHFPDPDLLIPSSKKVEKSQAPANIDEVQFVLNSILSKWKKNQILGTNNEFFDEKEFSVNNRKLLFDISETRPVNINNVSVEESIDNIPDVFDDPRFSNLVNFKFLPPISKPDRQIDDKTDVLRMREYSLSDDYVPRNYSHVFPLKQDELINIISKSFDSREIKFDLTTRTNNNIFQIFELRTGKLNKLDVIDYGKDVINGDIKHLFFVGFFVDSDENLSSKSFVHIFTIVFG